MKSMLQEMLEDFDLQDDFEVVQPDAMLLACRHCGEEVRAETADLHACEGM